jgi:hypothetical protein
MLRIFTKLALAGAIVGLAMAGTSGDSLAKGAKKAPASCVPGMARVTKSTCAKWGCHYQRCWWNGSKGVWYPSTAYCVTPYCPKY